MRNIVYYIASSIDGYIAGPDNNVTGFIWKGDGVSKYMNDLTQFDTVIMGRKTYESGYDFGLKAGEPAYQHMNNYIFSDSLIFKHQHESVKVLKMNIEEIKKIKAEQGSDIYLCGGGTFASWLLKHQQIELLKVKLNPIILGNGVKLFEHFNNELKMEFIQSESFEHGMQILTYKICY